MQIQIISRFWRDTTTWPSIYVNAPNDFNKSVFVQPANAEMSLNTIREPRKKVEVNQEQQNRRRQDVLDGGVAHK
jgi:hypothetical protein